MMLLLDTHLLLWAAADPHKFSPIARSLLDDPRAILVFSSASIWEIAIKSALGRRDFRVDPDLLRQGLLARGYVELPITARHAVATRQLPLIHRDPFDRLLIAQATAENMTLLTSDRTVAKYPGPVRHA